LIHTLKYMIGKSTDPYKNLALEEYLLKEVGDLECILYLWQNERTVVIGRNQNPWKECKIAELKRDGGKLVRRLSGGGAVYHDLGNLNFTFLARKENYNVERQLEVILRAVNRLGIPASKSGRNDITVEGKKFSGNAFYSDGIHCYHHGTLLIDVDLENMGKYLNVSRDKLISKGVDSVRSRVTNLKNYNPTMDLNVIRKELIKGFQRVYGIQAEEISLEQIQKEELRELEQKFSSEEWIYGRKIAFNYSMGKRFSWGNIDIQIEVCAGTIRDCVVYSDSLDIDLFQQLQNWLKNCTFSSHAMVDAIVSKSITASHELIINDIVALIEEENI
jgi:lipoate-protein ligase A